MSLLQIQSDEVTLTPAAAEAVKGMLESRGLKDHALRVFISGGGCSGHQYGMALEADIRPSDFVMEQLGVKVVLDDVSLNYLRGATIDYLDEVMGSGFKIDNPNATSTCGCGHSFQTDGQAPPAGGGCG
ncbi:MAG: iron-sulfur cluster insertion protein ErpA [Anaerolineae bacterium]|nr:iron-sulfur cluster insertion protein ErpA [Anaerolineae bacterium]